jgi:hypothetical protein
MRTKSKRPATAADVVMVEDKAAARRERAARKEEAAELKRRERAEARRNAREFGASLPLAQVRLKHFPTLAALSEATGIHESVLYRTERGVTEPRSLEQRATLARALRISVGELGALVYSTALLAAKGAGHD